MECMEKYGDKINICLIDEAIDINIVEKLISISPSLNLIQLNRTIQLPNISHGTVCLSLLVDFVQKSKIESKVNIFYCSASDYKSSKSYLAFLKSLELIKGLHIDILSLSIGSINRSTSREISNKIEELENVLVVASASNNSYLTYPASLPNVLGVKRNIYSNSPAYRRRYNPPDGIELIVDFRTNNLLRTIFGLYNLDYSDSNSILAPYVVSKLASILCEMHSKPTKEFALDVLTKDSFQCQDQDTLSNFICQSERIDEDKPPIVFLPYKDDSQIRKIIEIQRHFNHHDYLCSILSDDIEVANFIDGHYCLNQAYSNECVKYYQNVVSDSVILLHCNQKAGHISVADMRINDWQSKSNRDLQSEILAHFS